MCTGDRQALPSRSMESPGRLSHLTKILSPGKPQSSMKTTHPLPRKRKEKRLISRYNEASEFHRAAWLQSSVKNVGKDV